MNLARVINELFRVLRPEGEDAFRSPRGWFLAELNAAGIECSKSSLHAWLTNGVPEHRVDEIRELVFRLYARAQHERIEELSNLTETLSEEMK